MFRWRELLGAALASTLAVCAGAQQMTAAKVVFKNPGPFAQADLEAVAGVHAGQVLVLSDLQAAAQRLADTGCFEDVRIDSTGSAKALTILFLLRPNVVGALYPVEFENLVWATPEELKAVVHRSAPLFRDTLPETASVLDAVSVALQTTLASKGVQNAELSHELVPASSERPTSSIVFRVSRPAVTLGSVMVQGASGPLGPVVEGTADKLKGTPYRSGEDPGSTVALLLTPYNDAGYLDAKLTDVKVTASPATAGRVTLDLVGRVDSGPVFRVGTVSFAGSPVFSEQAFAAESKVRPGEIASRAQLLAAEAPVDAAYHKLGYMYAYVDPHAREDAATHTVSYALQMVPGEIYRLRTMQVQGLPPEAKSAFDAAWKMQSGDPYNADYVTGFLHNNTALLGLKGYAGTFQAAADPTAHAVDLTVVFARLAGR